MADQPQAGVELIFFAEEPPAAEFRVPTPRAVTDSEGRFEVTTYHGGDGAPAGEYRISAVWLTSLPDGADPEAFQSADRLQGKYANPDASGLRATVEPGNNELPAIKL